MVVKDRKRMGDVIIFLNLYLLTKLINISFLSCELCRLQNARCNHTDFVRVSLCLL